MTFIVILALYLTILFVVAWISRRHLGVPILALAAGALLANIWASSLTPIIAKSGLVIVQPPLNSIVTVVLTLLPAVLLMFKAPKVSSHYRSIIGSLVFALLGTMLTYGAFSNAVILDESSKDIVLSLINYQNIIITVGVVYAILELLFHKKQHLPGRK